MTLKSTETLKPDCYLLNSNYRLLTVDLQIEPLATTVVQADCLLQEMLKCLRF